MPNTECAKIVQPVEPKPQSHLSKLTLTLCSNTLGVTSCDKEYASEYSILGTAVTTSFASRGKTAIKFLLICGIVSSLLYIAADIFAANFFYPGYSYTAHQVSELSAVGAPTRLLWIIMTGVWTPLVIAFAIGVWLSAGRKNLLRATSLLLVAFGVIGLSWVLFAPMHLRGTVALATDAMHIVFAGAQVLVMVLFIALGSGASRTRFRIYSIVTIVVMLAFGALAGTAAPAIAMGQPTPFFGIIERVSVYLPIIWVMMLAIVLLGAAKKPADVRSAV